MKVATHRDKDGNFVVDIVDVETWADFEKTVDQVVKKFSGVILERNDAPEGSRTWFVRFGRTILTFDYDDMVGMSIPTDSESQEEEAQKIVNFLCALE